ncbi:DeoR/GlpR family transcriptional regulator of sugar metabolism [Scopulibacillus daqui]|uniref:DeoR/GlpR family transcriptional regulator of sugar metabolism n=1 Tax=Scopulibacillus daqui TaxID=1469162 RepID=A0ABS2Q3V8_9BACL|nr:DeoR/GlpR family DNA-binding transcription regulator [Scopulibacillus daqui]MBM7646177.1 DeoR/GlpR family transcriptional regulator of sugar metabolism [Scopulibacillus daqui]
MNQKQRLEQIKKWLSIYYKMSLEEIMNQFQVSRDTARRDLVKLEEDGEIVRVKGGAILPAHRYQITHYHERDMSRLKEKIAHKACSFIHDQETLLLDTSTTVELTARYIENSGLKVVTNSVDIINVLSGRSDIALFLAGGKFNPYNRNFTGPQTAESISKYSVDKLFIGACGIGLEGLTSPDEDEAYVKKAMIKAARQVILLTDHTKFQKNFFHLVCGLPDIDVIITDRAPAETLYRKLKELDIEVIIADKD